ncbi:MAG TPA: four helix bundle protein [Bacteroidales bacterium]|nr:four helix bundle protein [Bacteroidales bacterium]
MRLTRRMNDYKKNKNRGFKQLRVWQDSVDLFVLVNKLLSSFPYEHNKSKINTLDASHSIQRNISEGYCRRSPKEYLNFLNIALGSCGELNSSMISFHAVDILSDDNYELFDDLHYKTENGLLTLAKSMQTKIINKESWDDRY